MGKRFSWLRVGKDKRARQAYHNVHAKASEIQGDFYSATSKIFDTDSVEDQADSYMEAARDYVTAGKLKDAVKNYKKAGKLYADAAYSFSESKEKIGKMKAYHEKAVSCFHNAERLEKLRDRKWHGLEGKAAAVVSIGGIALGLLFMSSNITGNAIADIPLKTTSFIGTLLFIVGLIAGHYWFKNK